MHCPLCNTNGQIFKEIQERTYFNCTECHAVFLDSATYLSPEKEKARYLEHNNDVEDPGYQQFVQPLVDQILYFQNPGHKGLDFGAGTGPVITKLLTEQHYDIVTYDPFFDNNKKRLETVYDYIVCCEVIEHFHFPAKEFELLYNLLKPGGNLYCKTHLFEASMNFESWYYKDDPTHVFLYTENTFKWIQKKYRFRKVTIENRMIHFQK